jgi:hypothetical protein
MVIVSYIYNNIYNKYIVVCTLIMHMYVYFSYLEFESCYFNSEFLQFKPKINI